jgi:CPA2 family monovalent cation:H+ antiporter-2
VDDSGFASELLILIAVATAGAALFERLRLPSVVSFLLMGALIGPGGLGLVADPERVRHLAELGVVFLLFEVGLELPLDRVRLLWRRALAAGGLQVLSTLALVTAFGLALGWALPAALVMGALVAMSSTAVVMRLLTERDEIEAPHGQMAVGILLFQDLCIVPFLLLVPLLAAGPDAPMSGIALEIGRSLTGLAALAIVARFALPPLLDRMARLRSRELFTMLAVLVVMGSAVLAAELGLTLAVGAFVGGLVLSASPWAHQLFAEVLPLRGLLLGIFFTAVGMLFDPQVLANPLPVLAYVVGVVGLKAGLVALVIAWILRQGARHAVLTGLALAQTGEFSFVLAAAAVDAGVLDAQLRTVFVTGSIGTLIATPFLIAAAPRVARWVTGGRDEPSVAPPRAGAPFGHAVLVGFGFAGTTIARVLRARGIPYRAIEANADTVGSARAHGEPILWGDATRRALLERVGIRYARLVVIAISEPLATRDVVAVVREMAPEVPILARTRYVRDADRLVEVGATHVVAEEFESTLALVAETLGNLEVPRAAVARFSGVLRDEGYELLRAPPGAILDPWLAELLDPVDGDGPSDPA